MWALEPKLDGLRALVYVEEGQVDVRTRNGRAIADKVPELAGLCEQMSGRVCSTASLSPGRDCLGSSTDSDPDWLDGVTTSRTHAV